MPRRRARPSKRRLVKAAPRSDTIKRGTPNRHTQCLKKVEDVVSADLSGTTTASAHLVCESTIVSTSQVLPL